MREEERHKKLKEIAKAILKRAGAREIREEFKIGDKRVDVVGFLGFPCEEAVVAIECGNFSNTDIDYLTRHADFVVRLSNKPRLLAKELDPINLMGQYIQQHIIGRRLAKEYLRITDAIKEHLRNLDTTGKHVNLTETDDSLRSCVILQHEPKAETK